VLEREDIYQRVWGYTMARGDRSVDVFVRKLRHKLEQVSPHWHYVHTHFGVGYRFAAEPVVGAEPAIGADPPLGADSAVGADSATGAHAAIGAQPELRQPRDAAAYPIG
jgi:DNA-binding winged helix-turn-helix (wHTH) protein